MFLTFKDLTFGESVASKHQTWLNVRIFFKHQIYCQISDGFHDLLNGFMGNTFHVPCEGRSTVAIKKRKFFSPPLCGGVVTPIRDQTRHL